MKRIFRISIIVIFLVSCDKDTEVVVGDGVSLQVGEISLNSSTTKAIVDSAFLEVPSAIGVHISHQLTGETVSTVYQENKGEMSGSSKNVKFDLSKYEEEYIWAEQVKETEKPFAFDLKKDEIGQGYLYAYYPYTDGLTGIGSDAVIPIKLATSAEEENDYMYYKAKENSVESEDNKVSSAEPNVSTLFLYHALSKVTFRFCLGKTFYAEEANLLRLTVKDKSTTSHIQSEGNITMNISTGEIANAQKGIIQRGLSDLTDTLLRITALKSEIRIGKVSPDKYSFLVVPFSGASNNQIQVEFNIDDYTYSLDIPTTTTFGWGRGDENTYTITLNSKEVAISPVKITAWVDTNHHDIQ